MMFVGLQGSGKTTTIAKIAYFYKKKGFKVCMVCCDTFRAGAFDQLKQNAAKIGVAFYGSYTETNPAIIAQEGVDLFKKEQYEVILVDTSGRHKQEASLFEEMLEIKNKINPNNICFIMDSTIGQACYDQAQAFKQTVDIGSIIVTKLDGHAKGGGAISAIAAAQSPILFIGTGEHFDALEIFNAESFAKRLMGLPDYIGLINTVQNVINKDMIENLKQGKLTFRDMKAQFKGLSGGMSNIMSMVPQLQEKFNQQDEEQQKLSQKELVDQQKKMVCIFDSMNDEELDNIKKLTESRIKRIAKGSGTSVQVVEQLNKMQQQFENMMEQMTKIKGINSINDKKGFQKNGNQVFDQLNNIIPPGMMEQMGGQQNLMNMMKDVVSNPGMMNDMMKGMGMGNMADLMKGFKKKR